MRLPFILVAVALLPGCQEASPRSSVAASVQSPRASTDFASAPVNPTSRKFTRTDFDQHVARLKKRLPSQEFSIVIQEPFVVVGDEDQAMVRQRAQDTVKWAVDRLKQDFFPNDPEHILEIWLFKDKASYEKHTQLFLMISQPRPSVITHRRTKH